MQHKKASLVTLGNCLLAMGLAAGLPSATPAAESNLEQEAKADFEWFSSLGFPDVKSAPFVRVATGSWSRSAEEMPQSIYSLGFLLSSNGNSFTTLDMALFQRTYTKSSPGMPEHQRVDFETNGLKEHAGMLLDYLEESREPDVRADLWRSFGERLTERSVLFVLAWACWRQGLDDEAQRLYIVAQKTRKVTGPDDSELSLRSKLEKDLGLAMMWRAVLSFGQPSISRNELLSQLQGIVRNYPGSEYHAQAKATTELLAKMIEEDELHAKSPPMRLSELSNEERIRDLIFQLRDQNGQQWSQPGECDVFLVPNTTNTAAHQLVNIGYPAVPQLIAALDDPAFTRSVGFHRDFYFSHTVLTVGDCAAAILSRIAGKAFYRRQSTSSYLSKDGDVAQVRKEVEAWWAEFQEKGEKHMLVQATEAGNAPSQAQLLWQRYPEVAPEAVMKGVQASTDPSLRVQLIQSLANSDRPTVIEFLGREMREGKNAGARVAAAGILQRKGHSEATAAMIHQWKSFPENRPDNLHGSTEIIRFLASQDSPEAIGALGRNLQQRDTLSRMAIVETVGDGGSQSYGPPVLKRSEATRRAVEELLVTALQDTGQRMGSTGIRMGKSFHDPRICDIAGLFLNHIWPERYAFDLSASLKVRDRQRVECQNVWRKANHLPQLPLPQARAIQLPPAEANKVMAIEWAAGGVKPNRDFSDWVEALKDKLITASDVLGVLTNYTAKPIEGTGGIELKLRRDEDLTGVTISVRLLAGQAPQRGQEWKSVHQTVTLGQKGLLLASGGMFVDYSPKPDRGWQELTKAANQALAASPGTPLIIHVRIAATSP